MAEDSLKDFQILGDNELMEINYICKKIITQYSENSTF